MTGPPTNGGASERAVEAASKSDGIYDGGQGLAEKEIARLALAAAHDPSLGPDRSVRLGDVVEALRDQAKCYPSDSRYGEVGRGYENAAEFVETLFTPLAAPREFSEGDHHGQ